MTIEEAKKLLNDTKVYVNGKSEEIQKKLFKLGYTWGANNAGVSYLTEPFIYIRNHMMALSTDHDMQFFKEHPNVEISAKTILNIVIEDFKPVKQNNNCNLKTFDRVLVRDETYALWNIDIYMNYDGIENLYECSNFAWKYCIPYEGNEDLYDTTISPNNTKQ